LLTGIIAGMLGVGGGIIFVPALYVLLPLTIINPNHLTYIVIGTSLFCIALTSFSSGINHYNSNNVDFKYAALLALGSISSSILSVYFVLNIKPTYLQYIFSVVFILIALKMFLGNDYSNKIDLAGKKFHKIYFPILFGLLVGIFSTFTGLGGGILFVPILIYFFGLKTKKAIGTSSVVIFATTLAAAITYGLHYIAVKESFLQIGYIYLLAGIPIGLSAALGAYLGVKITLKTQPAKLRRYFSVLLLIVVIKITIGLL
jgi:uncharacterized membrane protein YfcA